MHTQSIKHFLQLVIALTGLLFSSSLSLWAQGTLVTNAIVNPSFEEARTVTNGDGTVFRTPVGWQTLRQGTLQQYSPNPGDPCYNAVTQRSDDHYARIVTPMEGLAGVLGGAPSDYDDPSIVWGDYGVDGSKVCLYPGIWQWSWDGMAGIKQTVANLPAGTYTLTATLGGKMKSARTDVDARWILGMGVLKGSDAAAVASDSLSVNEERPVLMDGLGMVHSVTFTVNGTEDITIKAYAHSTENAWEPLMFWCDDFQLYYHGSRTDVTSVKLNNPSFESKLFTPNGRPSVTGWTISRTGDATYWGVVESNSTYSKLSNLSAQAGNRVLLVYHSNTTDGSKKAVAAENTSTYGAESHVTLTTTTKQSLDPGQYECSIRFKLADFGGAQAQIGLTATPQHGAYGTTGLLWGQSTFWNCTEITRSWSLLNGYSYSYNTSRWSNLEWKTITTSFEVTTAGTADIKVDLLLPAGDCIRHENWGRWAYGTEALIDNLTLTKVDIKPILPEDGEYYLYNPETEQYLGTHGGANYGTQAMMDDVGLNVDLMPYTDNAIAVGTKIANGAGNDRLFVDNNAGVFCDGGTAQYLTLERTGALQVYYLKNNNKYITAHANAAPTGEDTPSDASKWVLKNYRQRVEDMWCMQPGDEPMDVTFLIQCPDLGYRDQRWTDGAWTTWAEDGGTDAVRTYGENNVGATQYRRGGNISNYIVENWHRRPHVYQTIQSRDANVALPAGVYTLTAQGFDGENGTTSYLYIKDENNSDLSETRVALPKMSELGQSFGGTDFVDGVISNWFTADKNNALVSASAFIFGDGAHEPTPGGDGDYYPVRFTIGVQNTGLDQWTVFDNFRLTYRPFNLDDINAEVAANAALTADIKNLGINAFQINQAEEPHMKALTKASAVSVICDANKEDYRNGLYILMQAKKDFPSDLHQLLVNKPDPSKSYFIKNTTAGYGKQNNLLTFKSKQSADLSQNTTAMGWTEASGSIFPQTVTFTSADVNCTAKVGNTQAAWTGASGVYGHSCTDAAGRTANMVEFYGSSAAGVKMQQTITGLEPGVYRAEFFATSHNAWGNEGATLNADLGDAAYVFATSGGVTRKSYFMARQNGGFVSGEPEEPIINDIVVGADGELTLGLALAKSGKTEWQTLQIKSLTKVEANQYTLSYERSDGRRVYVGTATKTGLGTGTDFLRPTTDVSKALKVKVDAQTTADGIWWLRNTECGDERIGGNGTDDAGFYTAEHAAGGHTRYYDMQLAEMTDAYKCNITKDASNKAWLWGAYHFATLILPFDADVPSGVEAYTISGVTGKQVNLSQVTTLKANTPYILYNGESTSNLKGTLSGFGKAFDDPDNEGITASNMTGSYFDNLVSIPTGDYFLSAKTYNKGTADEYTAVGLFRAVEGVSRKLAANTAYFTPPSAGGTREEAYYFSWEEDAIEDLLPLGDVEVVGFYDASGKMLPRMQKGLNILRMSDGTTRKLMVK